MPLTGELCCHNKFLRQKQGKTEKLESFILPTITETALSIFVSGTKTDVNSQTKHEMSKILSTLS